jgi:RNA polymerase sigma-70 factor (ECF subfamily)
VDLDDQPRQAASLLSDQAVAAVYDACAAGLYRYALMILADRQGAEDAVQQAFAKLLSRRDRAAGLECPEAYLRAAVRNECYSLLRSRRREPPREDGLLEIADPAHGRDDERLAIEGALRELPPDQREVVFLKVYEGLTFREIGERLGEPANTAASRHRYAMEKLRRAFGRDGGAA